jgi:hypothetical protein
MFKLVVLSCLVSVAFAGIVPQVQYVAQVKNYVEPQVSIVETPTINHVGSVVKNVPTGVSHHSSSVVHSAANIVEPIYAHGVEKKIVSTPIVKQVVEHVQVAAPIVQKAYVAAPVAYSAYPAASYAAAYPSIVQQAHPAVQSAYSAYPSAHSAYAAYPAVSAYSALPYGHHY